MITILDDVRTRIQKYSPPVSKKEFRRCNTDLKPFRVPRDKNSADVVIDEKEKMRPLKQCVLAWEKRRKLWHQNFLGRFKN
ncbi:hypothetical protein REPUB_Repub04eG0006700 [Reevesia pubescens]